VRIRKEFTFAHRPPQHPCQLHQEADAPKSWRPLQRQEVDHQPAHEGRCTTAITLTRIDPARTMHRFYRMDVQLDLSGAWCFIREWAESAAPAWCALSFTLPEPEAHRVA
jgi:hypothetical protein